MYFVCIYYTFLSLLSIDFPDLPIAQALPKNHLPPASAGQPQQVRKSLKRPRCEPRITNSGYHTANAPRRTTSIIKTPPVQAKKNHQLI